MLKCEVKRALGTITKNKASGGNGIPVELFQILKDDAVKVLHSICQQMENSAVATGLGKVSFHSNPKENQAKECFNYNTIALISCASKVMLKILQARLQQYMNHEIPDLQVGFRKDRGTRDKLSTSVELSKKQDNSRKTSISALLIMLKPLTVWITTVEHSERDGNIRPPGLPPEKSVCTSGSNS